MDNLTHTMAGVVLAKAGFSRKYGPGTTLALVVASNLPDVDTILSLVGGEMGILDRRTLTHSLVGLPVLAAMTAWIFHRIYRNIPWAVFFRLSLLGLVIHVFLDLINSFGVVLLYPFSLHRYELAWVFIIDLAIWGALIVPLSLSLIPRWRKRRQSLCQISLALFVVYVGICGVARGRASSALDRVASHLGVGADFSYVFPEPLGPHRFRGVLRVGDEYRLYLIRLPSGLAEPRGSVRTDANVPALRAIREAESARRIEWFFKAPVWKVLDHERIEAPPGMPVEDGQENVEAEVYDLRFRSLVLGGMGGPFITYRFRKSSMGIEGPLRER
ncbi:MAG: metal-dependent hydrolase [Planctomycetota bacterium]|nr:metal-dependent hydrolase [Planctomycetota bacterium]